ncbi:hypothetical protein F5141DRAFT_1142275 [Pisolithus sp. B1]|nr:hypothetical protein F5141DRAFT_1142275 [Pisolithus sp. B1]
MGFVMSIFVPFLLCCIFDGKHLNLVWGLSAGLGVIPAFLWWWTLEWDDAWEYVHIPYCLALKGTGRVSLVCHWSGMSSVVQGPASSPELSWAGPS